MLKRAERGASAVIVAGMLVFLFGMAAFAVDLGAVYAEDRQDQTAADLAVLAGTLEYAVANTGSNARDQVLDFVAANLTTAYSAGQWQSIWTGCTDADRSASFNPVPVPSGWSGTTLDCISGSNDELRVKVPDQLVESFFGQTLGVDSISARAVAQARLQISTGAGGVRPFGILDGLPVGEVCLVTSTSASPGPPCAGSVSGNFGTLNSQTWGGPTSSTDCGNPGSEEMAYNIAVGVDHLIGLAPTFAGSGGPWGGFPSSTTRLDDCVVSGGEAVPSDSTPATGPVNTMLADTGNASFHATKNGFISGTDGFPNATTSVQPLFQQVSGAGSMSRRDIEEKDGGNKYTYTVDNTPLWYFLPAVVPGGVPAACARGVVEGAADPTAAMDTCLAAYESSGATAPIFDEDIATNPRFGWVPQFHFTTWGPGTHWQPIIRYRMVYFDTVWFNCNNKYDDFENDLACGNNGNGMVFTPQGTADESTLSRGSGNSLKKLRIDQISAFLLPANSVPESIAGSFPNGNEAPFEVVLTR